MDRRELLRRAGVSALGLGVGARLFPWLHAAPSAKAKHKLLVYTRSQTFEHPCLKREAGDKPSLLERTVARLGEKHGFDVTCTKDGRIFTKEGIAPFDAFLFETTGDLTKEGGDKNPPMPSDGKKLLLDAVAGGKGFVGCHCASDTFHSKGDEIDPYIKMLGGEFITHGAQQKAKMVVVDDHFPGAKDLKDFDLHEEWYALKNFAPDLHVILAQDSTGMKGTEYQRPLYPATWARMHEKGRVFYSSMGHREDVWENPMFQTLLVGALGWAFGDTEAKVEANIKDATPKAGEYPGAKK